MAKMEFDAVDAALVVAGLASAFMLVGIAWFQLFDVDFTATQFTVSGISLSTAWILGYGSIVGVILTNDNTEFQSLSDDIQGLQGWYMAAAVGTLGTAVRAVVVVAVNATEPRREVRPALQTDPGLIRLGPEVHHPEITPELVGSIARREGAAIGDVLNPISVTGSEGTNSADSVA